VSYVGELGWELYIRPEDCLAVWDALRAAGTGFGMQPAGYKALDALRIEKGFLYWSRDITPRDNPIDAGLDRLVCMDKGHFIGRQALLQLMDRKPRSRMMGLLLDAGGNLYGGESVYLKGRLVGRIRSGNYGHTVKSDIGLVYLPLKLAIAGSELEVEIMGERIPARVAELPLVDPAGAKMRA
jgi:4-methylaminobutanoate oxidase (formaldehyde-forming)